MVSHWELDGWIPAAGGPFSSASLLDDPILVVGVGSCPCDGLLATSNKLVEPADNARSPLPSRAHLHPTSILEPQAADLLHDTAARTPTRHWARLLPGLPAWKPAEKPRHSLEESCVVPPPTCSEDSHLEVLATHQQYGQLVHTSSSSSSEDSASSECWDEDSSISSGHKSWRRRSQQRMQAHMQASAFLPSSSRAGLHIRHGLRKRHSSSLSSTLLRIHSSTTTHEDGPRIHHWLIDAVSNQQTALPRQGLHRRLYRKLKSMSKVVKLKCKTGVALNWLRLATLVQHVSSTSFQALRAMYWRSVLSIAGSCIKRKRDVEMAWRVPPSHSSHSSHSSSSSAAAATTGAAIRRQPGGAHKDAMYCRPSASAREAAARQLALLQGSRKCDAGGGVSVRCPRDARGSSAWSDTSSSSDGDDECELLLPPARGYHVHHVSDGSDTTTSDTTCNVMTATGRATAGGGGGGAGGGGGGGGGGRAHGHQLTSWTSSTSSSTTSSSLSSSLSEEQEEEEAAGVLPARPTPGCSTLPSCSVLALDTPTIRQLSRHADSSGGGGGDDGVVRAVLHDDVHMRATSFSIAPGVRMTCARPNPWPCTLHVLSGCVTVHLTSCDTTAATHAADAGNAGDAGSHTSCAVMTAAPAAAAGPAHQATASGMQQQHPVPQSADEAVRCDITAGISARAVQCCITCDADQVRYRITVSDAECVCCSTSTTPTATIINPTNTATTPTTATITSCTESLAWSDVMTLTGAAPGDCSAADDSDDSPITTSSSSSSDGDGAHSTTARSIATSSSSSSDCSGSSRGLPGGAAEQSFIVQQGSVIALMPGAHVSVTAHTSVTTPSRDARDSTCVSAAAGAAVVLMVVLKH